MYGDEGNVNESTRLKEGRKERNCKLIRKVFKEYYENIKKVKRSTTRNWTVRHKSSNLKQTLICT